MDLTEFKDNITSAFHNSDDLFFREVTNQHARCILSYLDGGSDKLVLEQDIISPIIASTIDVNGDNLSSVIFYGEEIKPVPIDECPTKIAEGDVIAFLMVKT